MKNYELDEDEEADSLSDFCADLMSQTQYEEVLQQILDKAQGEWALVWSFVGEKDQLPKWRSQWVNELFVITVPSPDSDPDFVMFIFYHLASMWNMTAIYNISRSSFHQKSTS